MPKPKCPLHRVLHFSASHETRSIAYRISLLSDVPLPPQIIPAVPPTCPCSRAPCCAHAVPLTRQTQTTGSPRSRSRSRPKIQIRPSARTGTSLLHLPGCQPAESSTDIIHPETERRPTIPLLTFDPASSLMIIIIIITIFSRSAGALAAQKTQTKESEY